MTFPIAPRVAALTLVALLLPATLGASPVIHQYVGEPADERAIRRSVRQLPALAEVWRCDCRPRASAVADGLVHVLGWRRSFALDAEDKTVLWDRKQESSVGPPVAGPLVLDDRVAVVWGDELVLYHRGIGVEIARVPLGGRRVEALVGPPLAALTTGPAAGEWQLVRVDPAGGTVIARAPLGGHPRIAVQDGRLWVARAEEETGAVLLELDPETLAPVGRRALPAGMTRLQAHDGTLYAFGSRYDRFSFVPLPVEPEDGSGVGEAVTIRGHELTIPSEDLGFAYTAPGWDSRPRELVRYDPADGSELWRTTFPCSPGPRLVEGDRIVQACGWHEGGDGLVFLLDAATGEVREVLHGPSGVRSIERAGSHWIFTTDERVVAVDPERRTPPAAENEPMDDAVDRIVGAIRQTIPLVLPGDVEKLLALGPAAWPAMTTRLPGADLPAALTMAEALGEIRHRPAAAAVAGRLGSLPPLDRRRDWPGEARVHPPEITLLQALARIGGADEVPAVAAVLLDPEQPWRVRQEAAFALVGIGEDVFVQLDRLGEPEGPAQAAAAPRDLEAAWRRAIREHLVRFGEGDGPRPLCPPDATPPSVTTDCLAFEVRRLEDEEGAAAASAALEVQPDERLLVVVFAGGSYPRKSFFLLTPVGDRWAVRGVWPWIG